MRLYLRSILFVSVLFIGCGSENTTGLTPVNPSDLGNGESEGQDRGRNGEASLAGTPAEAGNSAGETMLGAAGEMAGDEVRAGELAGEMAGDEVSAGELAGEMAGDEVRAGELAGEMAGDEVRAGELAGELAGEMAGESAGDEISAGEMGGEMVMMTERLGMAFSQYADDNWDALKAVSLEQISSGTDCAAFVSATLREFGFEVWAVYTDGLASGDLPSQTLAYSLFELGFERIDEPQQLSAGDICFSQDAYYEGVEAIECNYAVSDRDGWFPTHTYIFMDWEIEGSTAWAWVVDNQGRRHLRNMTVVGPKDQFQYFMRYRGQ